MKSQHQVILSIGSNQGNRLENVRHCELIHQKVGTVIKVSKVYETPSWVLTVTPSIIALIVHTFSSAHKILTEALKIEKELGVFVAKGKAINLEL
jgi:7,8-dihydro-6-hydroxymethylpterin-pyrophosphokinase